MNINSINQTYPIQTPAFKKLTVSPTVLKELNKTPQAFLEFPGIKKLSKRGELLIKPVSDTSKQLERAMNGAVSGCGITALTTSLATGSSMLGIVGIATTLFSGIMYITDKFNLKPQSQFKFRYSLQMGEQIKKNKLGITKLQGKVSHAYTVSTEKDLLTSIAKLTAETQDWNAKEIQKARNEQTASNPLSTIRDIDSFVNAIGYSSLANTTLDSNDDNITHILANTKINPHDKSGKHKLFGIMNILWHDTPETFLKPNKNNETSIRLAIKNENLEFLDVLDAISDGELQVLKECYPEELSECKNEKIKSFFEPKDLS
jgi:hypothetical protein